MVEIGGTGITTGAVQHDAGLDQEALAALSSASGVAWAAVLTTDGDCLVAWPSSSPPQDVQLTSVELKNCAGGALGRLHLGSARPPSRTAVRSITGVATLIAERAQHSRHPLLDDLVVEVAQRFMPISSAQFGETLAWLLEELARQLALDTVFYRRNDHADRVTVLIDEYPRRAALPDPDPLGRVHFDGADPVFAALEHLDAVLAIRPAEEDERYRDRVRYASGVDSISLAMVPLRRDQVTTGVLGFVHFGDRPWEQSELNALMAIASLLAQVEARLEAEALLHHLATHDELTGLMNRRGLLEELEDRLTADRSTAVLFVDLDRFKTMNDYLGHGQADQLLVTLARRLRDEAGPGDLVARLGGDEFIVVLSGDGGLLNAAAVADRLLEVVAEPVELGGTTISRTASLGIAVAEPGRQLSAETLLGYADAALYSAKASGRNRAITFDRELRMAVEARSETEVLLRRVIDHGGLRLHYHPEVDLRTGRIRAVEALVRWLHPEKGLLPASAFISVAEESGLVVDLGRWVLREACRQLAEWRADRPDLDLVMRVNVSPAQLVTPTFARLVADTMNEFGVRARSLSLEVTEHAVMQDVERSVALLASLRQLGVGVAIDDFGTGFSSMAQLKRLPIDTLKIDRGFVAGLGHDSADEAIIDAITRLADAFRIELVAEGVETPRHVQRLLELGCHRGQGFGLALPQDPEAIDALLAEGQIALPRFDLVLS
jgi:diguanylate cyclase (GGDEF)-like protein